MDSDLRLLIEFGRRLDIEDQESAWLRDLLMREWLYIRTKQGQLALLVLNRAQSEFARRYERKNIVLKARQLGISTYVAARFFLKTITHPGTLTVQVAHDQRAAEEMFRMVHRFLECLPDVWQGIKLRPTLATSHANVRQIVFPSLDSEYRVETAADENAGRGLTIQNLHCSEVSRWPRDAAATLASLRAAVPPGGEIVLESTANGAGGCFYNEWQRAESTGYVRHFLPWWWEPAYVQEADIGELTEDERELMQREGLKPQQIAFRRDVRANFGKRAKEEFAEDAASCFLASGESLFDLEVVERRRGECVDAMERRDNGRLLVWFPAQRGREYVVGVDPAGGGADGDYACAQVVEQSSGLQCAELRGHYTPQELARKVAMLAREYGDALVAVERNNHGHAVLAFLTTVERYGNLYESAGQAGWLTNLVTRPKMLEELAATVSSRAELFQSKRLLDECRTFVRHRDGRSGAASGAHDDAVMAMAVAMACRQTSDVRR